MGEGLKGTLVFIVVVIFSVFVLFAWYAEASLPKQKHATQLFWVQKSDIQTPEDFEQVIEQMVERFRNDAFCYVAPHIQYREEGKMIYFKFICPVPMIEARK